MLNMLTDTDRAVVETMRLRLTTDQALQYLKDNEFPMSRASYFRRKKRLEEKKLKRLYHIAQIGFMDQHLERLDMYEMGFKMMWKNVQRETSPYRQNLMIKDILLLQPYLSAYYDSTKLVIEKQQPEEYQKFLLDNNQQQQNEEEEQIKEDGEEEFKRLDNYNRSSFTYDDDKNDNRKF